MAERTVDAIKAKVALDSSDLEKAQAHAKKTGDAVKTHMTASTQHTLRFKESLTTLATHIGTMPPIVGETARSMESMFANTSKMSALGIAGGVAAAGLGILAEGAHVAQEAYKHVVESTESYMRVTGLSAEVASRQIEVFNVLGVSGETATGAMVKLEKAISNHPAKLEALGVAVERDAHRNVDMEATLYSVADAYNASSDAAKKMDIVLTAFGKTGADMIPILERGSGELRRMAADAKLVLTDADIEQARKYAIQQKQLDANWGALTASAGRFVNQGVGRVVEAELKSEFVNKRLGEAHYGNILQTAGHEEAVKKLTAEYGREFDAGQKGKAGLDLHREAMTKAAEAAKALAQEIDDATNAEEAATNAELGLERATNKVAESQDAVDKAVQAHKKSLDDLDVKQDAYNKTVSQYGKNSDQATTALDALVSAQEAVKSSASAASDILITQKEEYIHAASAAKSLAEYQAGPGLSKLEVATIGQDAFKKKLEEEAKTLAPGSDLAVFLQGHIDRLNAIPTSKTTLINTVYSGDSQSGVGARAAGGPVVPGRIYTIGERGPETLVMGPGGSGGTVIPNGSGGVGGSGGGGLAVTVNAVTNADAHQIAQEVGWELRKVRRAW